MSDLITMTETIEVEACLMVEFGKVRRPATPEDLKRLGWVDRDEIYDRIIFFMDEVGLDPYDEHSLLRAFVEDACGSTGTDVWTASDWDEIRNSYREMLKGK